MEAQARNTYSKEWVFLYPVHHTQYLFVSGKRWDSGYNMGMHILHRFVVCFSDEKPPIFSKVKWIADGKRKYGIVFWRFLNISYVFLMHEYPIEDYIDFRNKNV